MTVLPRWGIGVSGALGRDTVARLAEAAERYGYASFWFNCVGSTVDPADLLRVAVSHTDHVQVGVGVVPLDICRAPVLAEQLGDGVCDSPRVTLGVGSGAAPRRQLKLVADGLAVLGAALPRARLAVGGSGPRMTALAATHADALMLSMTTPQRSARIATQLRANATEARTRPTVHKYHRVAVGPDARVRLADQMISNGVWPADAHRPAAGDLLGTVAPSWPEASALIGDDLLAYPQGWRHVLRPLPATGFGDAADMHRLLRALSPP